MAANRTTNSAVSRAGAVEDTKTTAKLIRKPAKMTIPLAKKPTHETRFGSSRFTAILPGELTSRLTGPKPGPYHRTRSDGVQPGSWPDLAEKSTWQPAVYKRLQFMDGRLRLAEDRPDCS